MERRPDTQSLALAIIRHQGRITKIAAEFGVSKSTASRWIRDEFLWPLASILRQMKPEVSRHIANKIKDMEQGQ